MSKQVSNLESSDSVGPVSGESSNLKQKVKYLKERKIPNNKFLDYVLWKEYERIWKGKNGIDGESDNGWRTIEEFTRTFENYHTRIFKENLWVKETAWQIII